MSRVLRAVLVIAALVLLCGCADDGSLWLRSWTLEHGGTSTNLTLPAHFDRALGDVAGSYVLHTHVALPPRMRGQAVALSIPYFVALVSLRADGLDCPDVDASAIERYRGNGPHRFLVPARATADGALDLDMTVQHTWTQSGWLDTVPRLTTDLRGGSTYVAVSMFNEASSAAALAMMLLVGVAYGLVFLADRRRTAYGWFALASFSGASYSAYTLGLLQPVFGCGDENALGLCVCISSVSTILFTASIFGRRASRLWWGLVAAWMVMAVHAHGPFRGTRWLAPITIGTMIVAGNYCVSLLIGEWRRRRRPPLPALLASLGWPIVCVLALDDFTSWLSLGELYGGLRGASLGTMIVALLQAGALSAQLMESQRRSDALNAELQARLESLRVLNDELRRQIGNRSQQLAETLAKVGSLHLPVLALTPGDVVEQRYRVVRFLAAGGMAWVYEVERIADGRRLALKVLHGRTTGAALARLAREARLASEIAHPNIVSVVDVDLTAEGVLFVVMEHVDGKSLEQYLDEDPSIAWSIQVLRQIAEGLEAVHARGIVHRDLKPANVLVQEALGAPVAKIVDFGVSTLLAESVRVSRPDAEAGEPRMTRAGRVMGTPMYMAPELAVEGAAIEPSIDLYAFGVMAYELLVGRPPFRDPLFVRRLHGRSLPPPPSLAVVRPRIDRTVAALVDACLGMDPAQRPKASDAVRVLRNARLEADPSSMPSIRAP
jgi:predicted Ser/Thr protein kinase